MGSEFGRDRGLGFEFLLDLVVKSVLASGVWLCIADRVSVSRYESDLIDDGLTLLI